MTKNEIKVFSFLVIILSINALLLLILFNNKLLFLLQLELEKQKDTTILFSLLGLHALFALLTMLTSLTVQKFKYRYISVWGTVLAPILFFIYHFKTIITYQADSIYFVPLVFLFITLILNRKINDEKSFMRLYIHTLINPLDSLHH